MSELSRNVVDPDEIRAIARAARRVAVLGIKPGSHAHTPAHYVPEWLSRNGVEVVPVPVYFPDATEILGAPVYRTLAAVPGPIDVAVLFRRSADVRDHLPDILEKRPNVVWLQSGIRDDSVAKELAEAGIRVVQDRCIMVERRES
jgi:uncharacterized protein